jgi:hypothetical protein
MVDYPYTLKPSTLEDFLQKMPERPEPRNVSQTYFKNLGYTSSNDWAMGTVFRFIGFVEGNKITERFKNYRDTRKSKSVMAEAIKESYSGLLEISDNPCLIDDTNLENFFRTATGRGGRTLSATTSTFRTLCKFADFGAVLVTPTPTPSVPTPTPSPTTRGIQFPITPEGVRLDVSIRIELPITQDADVYDKIFKSLRKNLLASNSEGN